MRPEAFLLELRLRVFSPALLATLERNAQLYELTAPFAYASPKFGVIMVPAGFVTDFASVPRIVWSYLSPEDPAILFASVIHDYLYTLGGRVSDGREFKRDEVDEILREAMLASGARAGQAWVAFRAVRLFGSTHWKPSTK